MDRHDWFTNCATSKWRRDYCFCETVNKCESSVNESDSNEKTRACASILQATKMMESINGIMAQMKHKANGWS